MPDNLTIPQTTERMQHTINELHSALWMALQRSGGEIVIKPRDLLMWGKPGRVEWLDDPSNNTKIIRIAGKDT